MRFLLIVTHTLPLISLYADSLLSSEFGYREPNGFKNYIYTSSFNEDLFTNTPPHIGYTFPSESNYNILLHLGEFSHLEVSERDGNFIESLEFLVIDNATYHLSSFNLFSHNLHSDNSSIHHSIFYKRTGIYSYGLFSVCNFSPYYSMGNKTILYSDLNLYNLQLLQLFEIREKYYIPGGDILNNIIRNKNIISLTLSTSLMTQFYQQIVYEDEVFDITYRFSVTKHINKTEVSLHLQHRDKELVELQSRVNLKVPIYILTIRVEPEIRYITTPLFSNTTEVEVKLPKDYSVELKHMWEYLEDYTNKTQIRLISEGKKYRFFLTFSQEWIDGETEWNINGSISLKGY